jgi:hypothetical protein
MMKIFYIHKCSICEKYGMLIAIIMLKGDAERLAVQCHECGKRYLTVDELGVVGKGTMETDDDIVRAASLDELIAYGWGECIEWKVVDAELADYFS